MTAMNAARTARSMKRPACSLAPPLENVKAEGGGDDEEPITDIRHPLVNVQQHEILQQCDEDSAKRGLDRRPLASFKRNASHENGGDDVEVSPWNRFATA